MRITPFRFPPCPKTIEQKIMSLIHDSTKLDHLLQIHGLILKTSLDVNNFILAKFLRQLVSSPNKLQYARSIFNQISSPDTFIWSTMIRAYLNAHEPQESMSLFFRMRLQEGTFVDSFNLSLVLQACGRSLDDQKGERVHTHAVKLGFGLDLFVQTALVEMYAKLGCIEVARRIFDEMNKPDLVARNVLLAEYVRIGKIDLARQLFDKMTERDLVSWNTMIHGYVTCGNLGAARQLFDVSSKRDLVSWSSMIAGYAKSRQSNEALVLFNDMQLANVKPDKVTLGSVLSACGDMGTLSMGKIVHVYIKRNQIEVDVKLGTSLVDMYAKCGDIENAFEIFNKMPVKDVLTWSAMIMGLANHGLGELALDQFSVMISEGTKPNDITFIGVLSACIHVGLVDRGLTYFTSMKDVYGVTPKIEHYGCVIDLLGRAGRLREARNLIRTMPFAPDAITWRTLLSACKLHKNVALAEEATVYLLELEPDIDGNYVLFSNIYAQEKEWEGVAGVRRRMRDKSLQRIPGSSSIEVDNVVYEFVASDRFHPRSKEINEMLTELTERLNLEVYEPVILADGKDNAD